MRAALAASLSLLVVAGCNPDAIPPAGPVTPDPIDDEPGFHDPLSMPEEPTLAMGDFASAETCADCHARHYAGWKTSMHAYAMIDPVYRELVALRQADFAGEQDQFCTQCHSAIATRSGEIVDNFSFETLSPISLEGVTCESCHKVAGLRRADNSGHILDPSGPVRATIGSPVPSAAHEAVFSELHGSAEFCAGCHDVVEVNGVELERPYEEWLESPAPAEGTTCQDCHMKTYRGRAAPGAPMRTLHEHSFVGVDIPLTEGFATEDELTRIRTDVDELLATAARLEVAPANPLTLGVDLNVLVTVTNLIDGHNLPTGSTFIRQLWLELRATDATGRVLYETGTLDDNGDLRDQFSELAPHGDQDLIAFHSTLLDGDGQPVILPWQAEEHVQRSIPPRLSRTFTLFVPTDETVVGPIQIEARLRFRTHPPYLLRVLALEHYLDDIEIHDIAIASASVPVAGE
jgi:hypothetical protein